MERVKVHVNYSNEDTVGHTLQVATLLKKAFKEHPRTQVVKPDEADLIVNTLPDAGFMNGKKKSVWWDLETAEYHKPQYFDDSDAIFYPNHKDVTFYEPWKKKSYFLPLATDPKLFRYWKVPMEYDVVFSGREDANRGTRVDGLNVLEDHCKAKGYKFLRTNYHNRGEANSKIISSGKLTLQIAGLRNLEQRVFENSPIRPQLVDMQETNEKELKLVDPELKSFIPFYYKENDWSELLEKVDYYLAHDKEREAIVKYARKHFFANHTYKNRVERILEVCGF